MFKSGDTVQLKSGGPVMTVHYTQAFTNGSGITGYSVFTQWFDNHGIAQRDSFKDKMLKIWER